MDTIMEIYFAHRQLPLLYTENLYEPQQQHPCPPRWLALSHTANTRKPVATKLSFEHDIF